MRRLGCVLALCLLLVGLPAGAWANVPIPSLFGFMAPGWATYATAGGAFAGIVLIEWVVLKWWLALGWGRALWWVVIANLVSSFLGLIATYTCCSVVVLLMASALAWRHLTEVLGLSSKLVAGILLCFAALLIAWIVLSFNHGIRPWAFWGSLVPAFFLTLVIEVVVLLQLGAGREAAKALLAANAGS